jgi:RAD54-like protein 2
MVLKSPKGIYMQLENGKIIAIRTAFKVGGAGKGSAAQQQECKPTLEKAEVNAPEYKKGALQAVTLPVTVVIVCESGN